MLQIPVNSLLEMFMSGAHLSGDPQWDCKHFLCTSVSVDVSLYATTFACKNSIVIEITSLPFFSSMEIPIPAGILMTSTLRLQSRQK